MTAVRNKGIWDKFDAIPPFSVVAGVDMHLLAGDQIMLNLVVMEAGTTVPIHQHPNEQAGYVIRGLLIMTIGDETRNLGSGECYLTPGNVPHGATAGPDGAEILDIFTPPRADYVELAGKARSTAG